MEVSGRDVVVAEQKHRSERRDGATDLGAHPIFPRYSPMSSFSHRGPRPCSTASCILKASVWLYTGPALALTGAWLRREPASLGRTSLENRCLRKSPHFSARVHST